MALDCHVADAEETGEDFVHLRGANAQQFQCILTICTYRPLEAAALRPVAVISTV